MNSNESQGEEVESMFNEENNNFIGENNETQQQNRRTYHRHTGHQIQRLEETFRDSPLLGKRQRSELGHELGMEPLQVKFWFQNKRTQMKARHGHEENNHLRAENEKLREENLKLRESLSGACCLTCGHMVAVGDLSRDERNLRIENARLRDEINHVSSIAAQYMGKPLMQSAVTPSSSSSGLRSTSKGKQVLF